MPGLFKKTTPAPSATQWPSSDHKKCTNPKCSHPNPKQCVEGTYQCLGMMRGKPCQGTYEISFRPEPVVNACNNPKCHHVNSPQVAEGIYDCQGQVKGRPCRGTYHVSLQQARTLHQQCVDRWAEQDKKNREMKASWEAAKKQYDQERNEELQLKKALAQMTFGKTTPEVRRAKQAGKPVPLERRGAQRVRDGRPYSPPPGIPLPPVPTQRSRYSKDLPPLPPHCQPPQPPMAFSMTQYYAPPHHYHYVKARKDAWY